MKQLEGKCGLVAGVMNQRSIAYWAAKALVESGAEVAVACHTDHVSRVTELLTDLDNSGVYPFDATISGSSEAMVAKVGNLLGRIDFLVHSVAFAPPSALKARLSDLSYQDFATTMNVSVYSLIEMVRGARPYLKQDSTIITMTFPPGSQGVMDGYGIMGPAKAALESVVDYLNTDLGYNKQGVVVAAGPTAVKTVSSAAISHLSGFIKAVAEHAPQGEVTTENIADAIVGLVSGMAMHMGGGVFSIDHGHFSKGAMSVQTG